MIQSTVDWIRDGVEWLFDMLIIVLKSKSTVYFVFVTPVLLTLMPAFLTPILVPLAITLFLLMVGVEIHLHHENDEDDSSISDSVNTSPKADGTVIAGRDCYVCNGTVEEDVNGKLTVNKEGRDGGISEFSVPLCKVCTVSYSTLMDEGVSFQEMDHRGEPEEV